MKENEKIEVQVLVHTEDACEKVKELIEELKKAIEERGLDVPPFYGLALDDESADMEQIISDFRAFVKSIA